jgi:8-oxo-dGTP pyrophosphatase MutT (NUDIX family)
MHSTPSELEALVARLQRSKGPDTHEGITAAVAILLRADARGEAEVFFIQRAEREGDPWSGHMAFPGGRRDPADRDPLATAVRETREEVGLDLTRDARFITRLDDVPIVISEATNLRVAPFVFVMEREVSPSPNREVADVLWTPLAPMVRGELSAVHPFTWEGVRHTLPSYKLGGRVIWGLTYMMLQSLFEVSSRRQ